MDTHASEQKLPHIGRVVALPDDPHPPPASSGLPPYLLINWMVPNYPPSGLLQQKRSNGPGWNLVFYCRLSEHARALLQDADGREAERRQMAAIDLLRRFMHPTEGAKLRGERFKCIIGMADTERLSFGMVLKQMILRYNFKPFLSKTASFCYVGPVRARGWVSGWLCLNAFGGRDGEGRGVVGGASGDSTVSLLACQDGVGIELGLCVRAICAAQVGHCMFACLSHRAGAIDERAPVAC